MSMGDAVDLMDYWRDFPPQHLILRAVYLNPSASSPASSGRAPAKERDDPEGETFQKMIELQMLCGSVIGPQRPLPPHIKEMADYADEVTAKINKSKHV